MSSSLRGTEAKSSKLFVSTKPKRFIGQTMQKVMGRTKEAVTSFRELA